MCSAQSQNTPALCVDVLVIKLHVPSASGRQERRCDSSDQYPSGAQWEHALTQTGCARRINEETLHGRQRLQLLCHMLPLLSVYA